MSLEGGRSEVQRLAPGRTRSGWRCSPCSPAPSWARPRSTARLATTQANASYHLRVLQRAGLLKVERLGEGQRGIAKRYRALWDRQEPRDPEHADDDADAEILAMAEMATNRVAHRMRGVPGHFTDAALWVEPEVWNAVLERLADASRLLHESARPPRSAGTVRANLSVLAFRLEDRPEDGR